MQNWKTSCRYPRVHKNIFIIIIIFRHKPGAGYNIFFVDKIYKTL